jgi:hypothetical protein
MIILARKALGSNQCSLFRKKFTSSPVYGNDNAS